MANFDIGFIFFIFQSRNCYIQAKRVHQMIIFFFRMTFNAKRCFIVLTICFTILAVRLSSAKDVEENVCPYEDEDPELCKEWAGRCFVDEHGMPFPEIQRLRRIGLKGALPIKNWIAAFSHCKKTCLCGNCNAAK